MKCLAAGGAFLLVLSFVASARATDLDIRVIFGYKDARPARFVGDRYERLYLLEKLTAPCPRADVFSCGFTRDPEDANLLSRDLPEGRHRPRHVRLKMLSSSAGPDDDENRQDPYQKRLSAEALQNFVAGLKTADAVFYVGHSREGGGPDFAPPRLCAGQQVDYSWYQHYQPGLKNLLQGLKEKPVRQDLTLGLLSCSSGKHFQQKLKRASPSTKMIMTEKPLYYTDALEDVLRELSLFMRKNQ